MIQAILFDIGGTLRFTKKITGRNPRVIRELIELIGMKSSNEDFVNLILDREDQYKRWYETTLIELTEAELWTRFLLPDYPAEFVTSHAITLNQLWRSSRGITTVRKDTISTLRELSNRGYKLGIISNTTSSVEAPELLKENGLEDCVQTVVLSTVFGRKKPHPSIFLAAARNLGVPVEDCAYVGNSIRRDVVGSREAGIGEVVILRAEGSEAEERVTRLNPDHTIFALADLLDLYPGPALVAAEKNRTPLHMFDAALSTMWHVGQSIPFHETFAVARSLGFARFELNHQIPPEIFEKIDFNQFRIGSLHDPCPAVISMDEQKQRDWMISSMDEECRAQGVRIAFRTIDEAVKLHARLVVIHPGSIVADTRMDKELRKKFRAGEQGTPDYIELQERLISDRKKYADGHLDAVLRSLREIIDYASPTGLMIGLENRYRYYDLPILDEMETMLDLIDEEWYGFQYDIGHAQTLDRLGLCNHEEWLKRYANRMVGVHIHDVTGIIDHQKPGAGEVDFGTVARYLNGRVYRTLEVNPHLTTEDITAALDLLAEAGCIQRL